MGEAQLGDQVAFLGIAGLAPGDQMLEFIERTGTGGFPQVADHSGDLWTDFGADGRSTFLFLDGETGETRRTFYGEMDEVTLRDFAHGLLS